MALTKQDVISKIEGTVRGVKSLPKKSMDHHATGALGDDLNNIIDMAISLDPSKSDIFPAKITFSEPFPGMVEKRTVASFEDILVLLSQIKNILETH
jgi:hypothetical protein